MIHASFAVYVILVWPLLTAACRTCHPFRVGSLQVVAQRNVQRPGPDGCPSTRTSPQAPHELQSSPAAVSPLPSHHRHLRICDDCSSTIMPWSMQVLQFMSYSFGPFSPRHVGHVTHFMSAPFKLSPNGTLSARGQQGAHHPAAHGRLAWPVSDNPMAVPGRSQAPSRVAPEAMEAIE